MIVGIVRKRSMIGSAMLESTTVPLKQTGKHIAKPHTKSRNNAISYNTYFNHPKKDPGKVTGLPGYTPTSRTSYSKQYKGSPTTVAAANHSTSPVTD